MELPATQAMEDELPPTQQFANDEEETDSSSVGMLIIDKTSHPILPGTTSIGRDPRCKVHINNATVSGRHAVIEARSLKHTIFIKDLGSKNKTKINDTHLMPLSNYQIKDGDRLTFGSVDAEFKVLQTVEDSFISCTPQVNRKVRSVIPGTPDSLNASSASEGDVSAIPGTQNHLGNCFRQPETSNKTSVNNDNSSRVPPFNMEDLEHSIYSAETQKSTENKADNTDESIYELETQRPSYVENNRNTIENLETQRCDLQHLNSATRTSHNVSIYSAETPKKLSDNDVNDDGNDIEDLETQRYDLKSLNSTTGKSFNASIYNAETQKQSSEDVNDDRNNIEDLETQRCDLQHLNSSTRKSHNVSIYSAETPKKLSDNDVNNDSNDIEDLETQRYDLKSLNNTARKSFNDSIYNAETQKQSSEENVNDDRNNIEDLETQRCDPKPLSSTPRKSHNVSIYSAATQKQFPENDIANTANKSIDVSIYSAETQKAVSEDYSLENLETQQFIINKPDSPMKHSTEASSIYSAETQKFVADVSINESIENMETQQMDTRRSHLFQTPNLPKRKLIKKPLSEMETQKYDPNSSLISNESLEDAETERFEISASENKSVTESIHEPTTKKYVPDTSNKISHGDESIDDLETQQFINNNQNIVINESTDNIESQKSTSLTSIKNMETMYINEDRLKLNENNQQIRTNVEETNTVASETCKSPSQNNSSITNIDTSKSAELDIEDEMFSQNLLENCPFAFLPEESQENIDQAIDTSKNLEELKQNTKDNVTNNISNLSAEISNKSNISIDKKPAQSLDTDSETDEEGIFSNSISSENNIKINIKKSNSDSETDEEGIFSSHFSKESENSEISAKNKFGDNAETDEGVFSNPSKSNEKLNDQNNESGSETDEEGIFSNSLTKDNEGNENEAKNNFENNRNVNTARNDTSKNNEDEILDHSPKITNKTREENSKSGSELYKVQTSSFKQNSLNRHSPIPDSDDSLFDDIDDDQKSNSNALEKMNFNVDKSFNKTDNSSTNKDKSTSMSTENFTKSDLITNKDLNVKETLNATTEKTNEIDDLAPTQVLDTSKSVTTESDSEDDFLAPTQIASPKKVSTNINNEDGNVLSPTQKMETETNPVERNSEKFGDLILSPTQEMETETNPVERNSEKFGDLILSPTQKMDTEDCTALLLPTKNEKNYENQIDRTASVEDIDYETAVTQPIEDKISKESVEDKISKESVEDKISKESINSSKRSLEELEITCSKKLKSDAIQPVEENNDTTIEKNLKQMFDGQEEEKVINLEGALLTQQLENILESSQIEEDPMENIVASVPSPTLCSNRKNSKAKQRRKGIQLKNTSSQEKKANLNDTIERNLNDLFNESINDVKSYEPDSMMTQQLTSVLESQESVESYLEKDKTNTLPIASKRSSRSSVNLPSSSKDTDKRKSKAFVAQSPISQAIEKAKSKTIEESVEESQEEYFANLKSTKKRRSAILDSQSQEQTSDDEKELVYKHGIIGFVDDIGAIRTSKRVPLYEPKGRPFTSDSQSEGEDPDSSQRQKRFSLSLPKNVDLNSSLSDWDLKNTMTKTDAGKQIKRKRVLAKGTRGFNPVPPHTPVESEELVTALSTEGEDEIEGSQQKVGNLNSSLRLSLDVESEARTSQSVDSDEEFLQSMPDIKVAGTADCPPTSSQLAAAPCDDDDFDTLSLASVAISTTTQWYAQKRFDLVYKNAAAAKVASDDERDETKEENAAVEPLLLPLSPLHENSLAPSSKIDEFISSIGKKRPGDVTPTGSSSTSRASESKCRRPSPRNTSSRYATRSSSNLEVGAKPWRSFGKEANKINASSSDSDSDLDSVSILPKSYKPMEGAREFKRRMMELMRGNLAPANEEPADENDLEFARLREEFERKLKPPSTSAKKLAPKSSPAGARGKRARALTGGTLSCAGTRTTTSTTTTRSRAKAGIDDEDALVFQVPSAGGVDRRPRRRPALAITRSKRTVAEDSQNQPPKRAKTQKDHIKLQELSVVISPIRDKLIYCQSQKVLRVLVDNNATNAFRQNANDQPKQTEKKSKIKFPKPSESYVVLQRTKCKADSSELLPKSSDETLQNKGESEVRATSRRNKAAVNQTTKAEMSIAKGRSASKDSVVVEDSDAESSAQSSLRGSRSRRNKDSTSSVAKSNSKSESSANSSQDGNKSTKSTRGKSVRQTQKSKAPIKVNTVIPDSDDQESDESRSKSEEEKLAHSADSDKSEKNKKATSTSNRKRRIKDSDSEALEDSEIFVNTASKSRRVKNAKTSESIVLQDSDSEFSEGTRSINKKEIKKKTNVKIAKKSSDSERSTSPEKNNKLDIPAENKPTRNTRRAKAQNSSNSVFSESDNDQSKNSSVANASKSSRSAKQTRKLADTYAVSSKSQEEAELTANSVEINSRSRARRGQAAKKTNASSSSSSQNLKEDESDEISEKSSNKVKRARVNKSTKNTRSSPSPTPSQSLLTPTRSRRSALSPLKGFNHKVLFTGEKSEAHKNIVCKLDATVVDDAAKCTILVTDKVRRTCKFLCCVARGIPIVSFKWLDDSLKAQHFVDWEDYILKDPVSESQYKFNLQESLKKASVQKLLEGYTVLLWQIPATVLSTKELKEIVTSSGGKPIFRAPSKWPENIVIVTMEDKLQNAKKLITKAPKSSTIQSKEFLFTGILRQEVNLQEFKLSN